MTQRKECTFPPLGGWALILGASSGFGGATAVALARAGVSIVGVHLDRRAGIENVERIQAAIREAGQEAWFFNMNAADATRRGELLAEVGKRFEERGKNEKIRVLLHSLAFGSLKDYVNAHLEDLVTQKHLDMTMDVMANSLLYWVQDTLRADLFDSDGRIFAMTSEGSRIVWNGYGAVSAAKCALESHVRQLARELAPRGITANCIMAGVTDTPAARKIPSYDAMVRAALAKNPRGRLTEPEDVASAIVALSQPCTYWMTGNIIAVDGGETHCG
jgi:NAD(P)-dependent dehydrogenase (short-subunit alcohol dehydrogenase family)